MRRRTRRRPRDSGAGRTGPRLLCCGTLAAVSLVTSALVPPAVSATPVAATPSAIDTPDIDTNVVDHVERNPDEPISVIAHFANDATAADAAADPTFGDPIDAAVPLVSARVDAEGLAELRDAPGIVSIVEDREHTVDLATSVSTVEAPAAWAAGYTGAGTRVAVFDTGVLSSHPFLAGRIAAEACFSGDPTDTWNSGYCPGPNSHEAIGPGAAAPCPDEICWHGTHVAGIIAGHDGPGTAPSGVAPGTDLMSIQVFSRSKPDKTGGQYVMARDSDLIAAMQWVALQQNSATPIVAVNMSLSGDPAAGPCDNRIEDRLLKIQVDALRAIGITVVAATGNDYDKQRVGTPACISTVLAVGALTDAGAVASFSNSSAMVDVLAPGETITSSRFSFSGPSMIPSYGPATGTSMATPHVSGALAVVAQARGVLTPGLLELALDRAGDPVTDFGNGRRDPRLAIDRARTVPLPPIGMLESTTSSGSVVTLSGWTLDPDTSDAATVEVRVGGVPHLQAATGVDRPDVFGSLAPLGTAHGFSVAIDGLPIGPHSICVGTLDTTTSVRVPLGCRTTYVMAGSTASTPRFPDVALGSTFAEAIDWLASLNVTTGYTDGRFHPTSPVTRQGLAIMLYRLAGSPAVDLPAVQTFSDVGTDSPFRAEIEWAAANGIVQGFANGSFGPGLPLSRQTLASMLHRSVGQPAVVSTPYLTFPDVPIGHLFGPSIEWLAQKGIADGNPDGTFGATTLLSRQALAAFLARQHLALS